MERLEEDKEVIDIFHYHEVLDRAFTIQCMIEELLEGHPVVMAHPSTLGRLVGVLQNASAELYQEAGTLEDAVIKT